MFDEEDSKPPKNTRFQKGRSGNPSGRPRKSQSSASESAKELERALRETITIQENGRTKRITKRRAIMKQVTNKAALGDPRALRLLLQNVKWSEEEMRKEIRDAMRPVEQLSDDELQAIILGEVPQSVIEKAARRRYPSKL